MSAAAADRTAFEWMRAIHGKHKPERIFRVRIPLDVYEKCSNFPHDIRIFDSVDRPWPFYLEPRPSHPLIENVPVDDIQSFWADDPQPHLRIDLAIARHADGSRATHDRIRVATSGRRFIRRIEVHGSENQADWQILGEGYLVRARHGRIIQARGIRYPLSDYPYLQVRVYPDLQDASETFTAGEVDLRQQVEPDMVTHKLAHAPIPASDEDVPENARVFVLDLGYEKHPVEMMRLRATGGEYVRTVAIHTRDDPDQPWHFSGGGSIYRTGDTVKDLIRIRRTGRYMKCTVYHDGGAPLNLGVMDVLVTHDHLIIEAKSGRDPVMYYGGPHHVPVPPYDLRIRAEELVDPRWELHALAPPVRNPDFRATRYERWGPILAAIAVGLTGIGVFAVIVMMFRHAAMLPPSETE